SDLFFNHKKKPFDDARVRRALTLAIDRWGGAPALSKIAVVKTVGGIVFPGSPLAATKDELQQMAGFGPDIEKSRVEAKRLLKEAGAENLSFELLNRDVDQPYKYVGIWLVDQWSKIGVKVTQKVVATGPWFQAMRSAQYDIVHYPICRSTVNPVLDVGAYLPSSDENYGFYDDPQVTAIHDKLLHESDPQKRGGVLTYMIPADAPPSFDGHREATFATVHAVAPFYSVLIRANPENPASTTEFVCDVCTEIPEPTDGGRTYSFMIRNDIKFSDGSRLTAADVAASWNKIVDPPDGVISARRGYYSMI